MSPAPNPEITHARARHSALRRYRAATDPAVAEAARDLATANLAEYIRKTVDAAPPLTPEQRDRLALLLRGGDAA